MSSHPVDGIDTDPSCFGFATTFDGECPHCQACYAFDRCGPIASESRDKLLRLLSYRETSKKTPMQPKDDTKLSDAAIAACAIIAEHMPEPDPTPIIESGETLVVVSTTELDGTEVKPRKTTVEPVNVMSKKAKALYTSLDGRGVDWRKLRQGINPLRVMGLEGPKDVGPNFMHLTVKMLLEQGSFTTRELQAAFVSEFGWGVSTASSHVSIVNSLLTYAGAVTLEEGKMTRVTE